MSVHLYILYHHTQPTNQQTLMDFADAHEIQEGVAVRSKIRILPTKGDGSLEDKVITAANQAARDLFGTLSNGDEISNDHHIDAKFYPERCLPQKSCIEPGSLIVIFESFDTLNFVYAQSGDYFQNRNGSFAHDDFIGKPFGSIVRSRNNDGYGFVYLLRPTPELWARSLFHRTQIVHELDASMICHNLDLRPNMTVIESGTGSGALSHAVARSIAPRGKLYTYEFHASRAQQAREEFERHGLSHLIPVTHRDVCGKDGVGGGFPPLMQAPHYQRAHAILLDLPEPWLAIPHAADTIHPGGRLASYSPCVEQVQRCVTALKECGFHSIRTMEFRLKEHFVDQVELWSPPKGKRPRMEINEEQRLSLISTESEQNEEADRGPNSRKKLVCTRPFNSMRGHTAFLTFATASSKVRKQGKSTSDVENE
jgi:tRNA (adenine57-N1/adenine58-N1)-methyltransferase catalytic subunit